MSKDIEEGQNFERNYDHEHPFYCYPFASSCQSSSNRVNCQVLPVPKTQRGQKIYKGQVTQPSHSSLQLNY